MLRTKSVWSPIDRQRDGLRILASRFRGRGMPTIRYDVWMASLRDALAAARQGDHERRLPVLPGDGLMAEIALSFNALMEKLHERALSQSSTLR